MNTEMKSDSIQILLRHGLRAQLLLLISHTDINLNASHCYHLHVTSIRFCRVVAGMVDPDPRTAGGGLKRLADAGIDVVVGIEGGPCRALNAPFVHRIIAGHCSGVYGVLSCALSSSSGTSASSSSELDEPTIELAVPASHKVSLYVADSFCIVRSELMCRQLQCS
jgi:hypothetical protein